MLYVRGIYANPADDLTLDAFSIRLARTQAEALNRDGGLLKNFASTQVNSASDRVTLANHGFVEGQAVTYRSGAAFTFPTENVDVKVVPISYRDANDVLVNSFDLERGRGKAAIHYENTNNIFLLRHNLATGDAVTYRAEGPAIGGLVDGNTYFVIKINDNEIQLARSYYEAMGLNFDNRGTPDPNDDILAIPVTPIAISSAGPQGARHSLARNLSGLNHDQVYYVRNVVGDTFQLSNVRAGGSIIQLDTTDAITVLRRDNGVARVDRPLTRGGVHRVGTLGIDLLSRSGTQALNWDLTGQPSNNNHRFLAPSGDELSAIANNTGDGISNVTAFGGSGGGIDVGVPTALLRVTPNVSTQVASLSAQLGNIDVKADSQFQASTFADTGSGGVVTVGEAHADTIVGAAPTVVQVFDNSTLTAGGDIVVLSDSTHSVTAIARSVGGGLIAGKIAETTARLLSKTETVIGRAAKLQAGGLLRIATDIDVHGLTSSETYNVGIGAGADSDNTNDDRGVTIKAPTRVVINEGVEALAKEVDINANVAVVNVAAKAKATSYSPILIGVTTAYADAYADVLVPASVEIASTNRSRSTTRIRGDEGVDIRATVGPINVARIAEALSVSTIPPQAARRLGEQNVTGTIRAQPTAVVEAGPRFSSTRLSIHPEIPQLAFYSYAQGVNYWDADIRLLSPTFELQIDSSGNPITQKGVTYRRIGSQIHLDNIINPGPGQVLFEGQIVKGDRATLKLDNAAPNIKIVSYFGDLFVNTIRPVASGIAGIEPKVTIGTFFNLLEFDVKYDYGPTTVSITNYETREDDFNIRLQGVIDNPLGTTEITSTRDVASSSFDGRSGVIRTNRLVGQARNFGLNFVDELDRIPIDIVEAQGLPGYIKILATQDIFVGLQGLNRDASVSNFRTMLDDSLFSAGQDADIVLLGGRNQQTAGATPQLGIIVHETARVITPIPANSPFTTPLVAPRNTTVTDHFRNSSGTAPSFPLVVFGTGNDLIPVTYDLGTVRAGRNIDIYKADSVTSTVNIFSDVDVLTGALAGNIDSRTNGFIDYTERSGDMRVGRIASSNGNVELVATRGSIIDLPDGAAITGDPAVDVSGIGLSFYAPEGSIGTFNKRLDIDSSVVGTGRVYATALQTIYLNEAAGNLNVGAIRSILFDLDIVIVSGSLIDIENDPAADLIGSKITLALLLNNGVSRGSIGSSNNAVEMNSSVSRAGGLTAQASGSIYLVEIQEELYVLGISGVSNVVPDVFLTVVEDASDRNDLIFKNTSNVATATLFAGDDFLLDQDDVLTANGLVTIVVDSPSTDKDLAGSTVTLLGQMVAPSARLISGDDIDLFTIKSASRPTTMEIFGGSPTFPVYPGDKLLVEPQAANIVNTTTSILLGEGTVTAPGRGTIQYHSIEMVDNAVFNDPPVNLLPPTQVTRSQQIKLSLGMGNGLKVLDPDAGDANNFSVTLTIPPLGTLSVDSSPGVTISGNGTAQVTLVGTITAINTLLDQGVTFTVPNGFSGTTRLNMFSNDRGNTGVGGPLVDDDDLTITIGTDFNEPPVNSYPRGQVTNTTSILLSPANGNGLSVADPDAGQATNFRFSIGVDQGTLSLVTIRDLLFSGSGTTADPLVLIGTLAQINSALASGVFLSMPDNFAGKVRFTMISNDAGNTGTGGALTDTDSFIVDFVDPNIAPVNVMPPNFDSDQRLSDLNWRMGRQIQVTDRDAGSASNFSVTLTASTGRLTMRAATLLQYPNVLVTGDLSASMRLEGTLADINGVLFDGLQYAADSGFFGTMALTVVSDDAGNTGAPGPLTDTDTVNITIVADANDPPVNRLPPAFTTNSTTLTLSQINGNSLSVVDADAGNATNFEVRLVASVGTLTVTPINGLTAQGTGTAAAPLRLTGSLASINFVLGSGVRVTMPAGYLGVNTIEMFSNDAGNSGPGGPLTDRDSFDITVVAADVNDPPVNRLPANFTTDQIYTLSAANGNALSVTDPDAGNAANFSVTLTMDRGFLSLANMNLVQVVGTGSSRSPMTLTGTLANINATLAAGVTFARGIVIDAQTPFNLTMVSNDAGNTGAGGPLSDTDVLVINALPVASEVNDPPINSLPPNFTTDRTSIVLSAATGNQLSVSDVDAGSAANFSVTLSGSNISFQLLNPLVQFSFSSANGTNRIRLEGSMGQINETLARGVVINAQPGFLGTLRVAMVSNDAGNTGSGGPLTDTDALFITVVAAINDPPVNNLPASFDTDRKLIDFSTRSGNAISVSDVDAGNAVNFRVQLTPSVGTLSLPTRANVTVSGAGTTASPLVMVGSLASINAALAAGLTFVLPADHFGVATLTVLSNDAGNTGIGGAKTDLDTLQITVSSDINDAPVNSLPTPITTDVTSIVLSSALGNALSVFDSDAGDANNFSVRLTAADGSLSLVSSAGVTAIGLGTSDAPLMLTGSLSRINAVLAGGVRVLLPTGFTGNTSVRMLSNDAGNTGAGGPLSDDDTLSLTVTAGVNDGPINILPPPIVTEQTSFVLSSGRGNALSVVDIDAGNAANFVVTVRLPVGTLSLVNAQGIVATGIGTTAAPLVLTGTLAAINTALARGLTVNLPAGFTGTTALVVLSNDNGNTGSGGPLTDLDLLSITVQANVNDPPVNKLPAAVNIAPAPFTFSQANGNAISVEDVDAGAAVNFSVSLSIDGADLSLVNTNPAGVTVAGIGSLNAPLLLTGSLSSINAALASGLVVTPKVLVFGPLSLRVHSNDAGNTGSGGPLTDTDYLDINVLAPANVAPYVVSVSADSTGWVNDFRDYVDGVLGDKEATGYRVPYGPQQLVSLPWVNVDRIKITFSEDIGASLDLTDFGWNVAPGFTALAGTSTVLPKILGWSYDSSTYTVTLSLGGAVPAAVFDLTVSAAGVFDSEAAVLDGNGLTA